MPINPSRICTDALRHLQACTHRQVLHEDGRGRLRAEVDHESSWRFWKWGGSFVTSLLVEQVWSPPHAAACVQRAASNAAARPMFSPTADTMAPAGRQSQGHGISAASTRIHEGEGCMRADLSVDSSARPISML